jgi:hypothetical protein
LLALTLPRWDHALFCAHDHRSNSRNRFSPAGFHVAEHDQSGRPELDDFSGRDIVHELGAGNFALHVFNDGDRRLRCSQPGKTNETNNRGKQPFSFRKPRSFESGN